MKSNNHIPRTSIGILGTFPCLRNYKVYGTFFDELFLLMIGFDRGQRLG